jgi:hypothetical protein
MGWRSLFASLFVFSLVLTASVHAEDAPPAPNAEDGIVADAPDPKLLLAEIPAVDTDAADCPAFKMSGVINMQNGAAIKVTMWHRGPEQLAWRVVDAKDDTPFMAASGRQFAVYDPVRPVVLHSADAAVVLELKASDRNVTFNYKITAEEKEHPRLQLDLRSLMSAPSASLSLDKHSEKRFQLTSTSPTGNQMVAAVERNEGLSTATIRLNSADGSPSPFVVRIEPWEPEDEVFAFPDVSEIEARLPVLSLSREESTWKQIEVTALIVRTLYVHAAARSPDLRDVTNIPGLTTIDWDEVARNDSKHAPLLRTLFNVKPAVRQAGAEKGERE